MNGRRNNIQAAFSPYAQGSSLLQRIALDAMKYNKNERPSPEEIHNRITNIKEVLGSAILEINKHQKDGAVDFGVRGFYWRLHRSVR